MSDEIEFDYIGWCKGTDKKTGVEHDKVWTAFHVGDKYYAGWGRRGKALSFKKHTSSDSFDKAIRTKEKKYDEVDTFQLFSIFPYFTDEVSNRLTYCILSNKIR